VNAVVGVVALMLGVWLLKMMMEERQIRLILSRATVPVYLFILISFIAFAFGQLPWYVNAQQAPIDTQLGGLAIFFFSGVAFLLVAHMVNDLRKLQTMTWAFIAAGAIYVLGRAVGWGGIDRIYDLGFSAGSMFWTWLVALAFGQFVFNNGLRNRWRIVLGVLVVVTFYVAYVQGKDWKSGWLPPLVAVAAIIAFRFWKPAFVLVPLVVVPAIYLANILISSDQYSWSTRMDAWIIIVNIVKANPFLGLGFANYYWVTPLFPIRGWAVRFNSHNQYLDILAQTGFVGLACFLWLFWELGRLSWRLRERVPDGFAKAYVYGALGGLVGTLVAGTLVDWVLPFVYNIGFTGFRASILVWMFLGGLVSLDQLYRSRS
jgi:O-antigen ligase